ncbi:DUF378 domain-containing protein [Candidatus Woesearchaeota archaeon]|nr:DUF378 domain-containing protein [Candidatus Woesearchaeota archaeon]
MAEKMSTVDWIAAVLLIIGGLNWGLVGINRGWDLVNLIFGSISWLASIVYILVGIAALYKIYQLATKK